ncbi:TRAP transporter substrate-binding protein [Pseudooceanicola nitratireducens]|jgi:TRAP-type C4-dicarboxylate transport system substrate-binding protein|uniref:C4-dicarboxylate TRAP transporter substrate-binding protein n=1 Tax=Pseudooceanicola nitratireducens TaxID=517719 RepID=UPI003108E26C
MRVKLGLAVLAAYLSGAGLGQAEQLNYAYGFPAGSSVDVAAKTFAETVAEASGGDLTVRNFPLSLLSLAETTSGLRDGLADIGFVLAIYNAAEFPTYSLLSDLNMSLNLAETPTGKEHMAYAGAITEYAMTKCPECTQEFTRQNQLYMGGGASPIYVLVCTTPVASMEDLKGKRVRTGGPGYVRFVEHFGAISVQLPANENYEALGQGLIDCATQSMPELTNYNLWDVVTHVTVGAPGGLFAGAAPANINLDTWRGLDEAQRKAMIQGASVLIADGFWGYHELDTINRARAAEEGIELVQIDDAFRQEVRAFSEADMKGISKIYQETFGVSRSDEIIAEFNEVLDRWQGLVAEVNTVEQLRGLLWDEIYSKIDPATYGL